ncbi:unnamed protein product [Brassica rapa subsp. narinosa]
MLVIHASTLPKYPPNNKMDANQFPYTGLSQTMTPASGFTLAGTKRKKITTQLQRSRIINLRDL